jgi:hypothetical protein
MKKSSTKSSKKKLSSFIDDKDIDNSKPVKKSDSVIPTKRLEEKKENLSEKASEKNLIESKEQLTRSTSDRKENHAKNDRVSKSASDITD